MALVTDGATLTWCAVDSYFPLPSDDLNKVGEVHSGLLAAMQSGEIPIASVTASTISEVLMRCVMIGSPLLGIVFLFSLLVLLLVVTRLACAMCCGGLQFCVGVDGACVDVAGWLGVDRCAVVAPYYRKSKLRVVSRSLGSRRA